MDSKELTEWMAYSTLEPFGGDVPYLGHAITASTIANANRRKGTRAYKVDEFMPKFTKQAQTPEEMLQIAEMMTIGLGGQDLRQDTDNG
jgi:hypothetical protein